MSSEEPNPDLESFREQWKAEVRAKHGAPGPSQQQQHQQQHSRAAGPSHHHVRPVAQPPRKPPQSSQKAAAQDDDEEYAPLQSFDDVAASGSASSQPTYAVGSGAREPVSALDHYEKAVEKEAAGNLGESLRLYRKAFRLDDRVDQKYRNKHFPKPPPKQHVHPTSEAAASTAAATAPNIDQPQSMKDLISSFSAMSISPAPPEVEGMPPPLCPLATLPEELLVHILQEVAILDVADFVRLAQVCKRLAYLVATEERVWRRICLGSEFGFGGMHYYWQRKVNWKPLTKADIVGEIAETESAEDDADGSGADLGSAQLAATEPRLALAERAQRHARESTANTLALYRSLYGGSWQRMFRQRPRIRFNGCYISTVNYMRSGQADTTQVTWGSPVHIVTYYRYLRFFRDGTVISLLTTTEPAEVVHHMTREVLALHAGGANPHLPSSVMRHGLRGRWRLSREADDPDAPLADAERGVMVETEGVSKYIYRLDLTLGSAGKGARNNKLAWKGFYSYNPLTEDWAEFAMRNHKPFYFSRVKSYGVKGA